MEYVSRLISGSEVCLKLTRYCFYIPCSRVSLLFLAAIKRFPLHLFQCTPFVFLYQLRVFPLEMTSIITIRECWYCATLSYPLTVVLSCEFASSKTAKSTTNKTNPCLTILQVYVDANAPWLADTNQST